MVRKNKASITYDFAALDELYTLKVYIYSIFQAADDSMWVTTDLGMFVMDYTTGKYRIIPDNEKTDRADIADIAFYIKALQ